MSVYYWAAIAVLLLKVCLAWFYLKRGRSVPLVVKGALWSASYYLWRSPALLALKGVVWSGLFYLRRRRAKRMKKAGIIQPAPPPGSSPSPAIDNTGLVQGNCHHGNCNATSWSRPSLVRRNSCPTL